ncbi:hypothetical protein GA0115250_13804, partial [Streptomyces sp. BvitLS-983]
MGDRPAMGGGAPFRAPAGLPTVSTRSPARSARAGPRPEHDDPEPGSRPSR